MECEKEEEMHLSVIPVCGYEEIQAYRIQAYRWDGTEPSPLLEVELDQDQDQSQHHVEQGK